MLGGWGCWTWGDCAGTRGVGRRGSLVETGAGFTLQVLVAGVAWGVGVAGGFGFFGLRVDGVGATSFGGGLLSVACLGDDSVVCLDLMVCVCEAGLVVVVADADSGMSVSVGVDASRCWMY